MFAALSMLNIHAYICCNCFHCYSNEYILFSYIISLELFRIDAYHHTCLIVSYLFNVSLLLRIFLYIYNLSIKFFCPFYKELRMFIFA